MTCKYFIPQNGIKYLQVIYLAKNLYQQYIEKNLYNLSLKRQ
jgi:hypothetical protein